MTNTISVPRELLEHIAGSLDKIALQSAFSVSDEIRALLEDPAAAVEGQEPVAWVDKDGSGHDIYWYQADIDRLPDGTKLYASPVAQQKVVMPNRMTDGAADYAYARYSAGWNACLDELARLNGGKP